MLVKKWWKIHSASVTHHLSLPIIFLHPPTPTSPLSLSSAVFPSPLSLLSTSLLPRLSCQLPRRQRCHGYRAAGQISWCLVSFRHVHKSLSCMCALFLPCFPVCDPCGSPFPRTLSRLVGWFFSFIRWSLSLQPGFAAPTNPTMQCGCIDFVYKNNIMSFRHMLQKCRCLLSVINSQIMQNITRSQR